MKTIEKCAWNIWKMDKQMTLNYNREIKGAADTIWVFRQTKKTKQSPVSGRRIERGNKTFGREGWVRWWRFGDRSEWKRDGFIGFFIGGMRMELWVNHIECDRDGYIEYAGGPQTVLSNCGVMIACDVCKLYYFVLNIHNIDI